jgi:hypothetical protein
MKLSKAISQGSKMIKPKAGGQYFAAENAGCALGMAAIARGCTFGPVDHPVAEHDRRTLNSEQVWGTWMLKVVERPCECWRLRVPREMRIKDIIAHLFDRHVMGKRDWNLAQLVAWVETVEPVESVASEWMALQRRFMSFSPVCDVVTPTAEEIREWQLVRGAFEARQKVRRKAGQRSAEGPVRSWAETWFMD